MSSTTLSPVSVASLTVGFVSFAFTLAIWIHAFWDAFLTIGEAPQQLQDALSTLRQGLYEEREYLKRKRRRPRHRSARNSGERDLYMQGGPDRVLGDAVKDLIRDFKRYERPFLALPEDGREHGREKDLEWSFDATQQYYRCDLIHRVLWLRSKNGINSIGEKLQRIQTRRIAVEVTETRFMIADLMGLVRDADGRVGRMEERLRVR